MANAYSVVSVTTGYPTYIHHNNKWAVHRTPAHSSSGEDVFVAAGDKAQERAEYVCALFQRVRSADDERFLQRLLTGDSEAEAELRDIVGAKPRSTRRGGRFI